MTNQQKQLRYTPLLNVDTVAIAATLRKLAGASLCTACEANVNRLVVGTEQLITEAHRLSDALTVARLEAANLRAAIRATLGADAEGEADPLAYLRDELPESGHRDGRWCG